MNKSMLAGLIALVLVLSCGIAEFIVLKNQYKQLHTQCEEMMKLAKSQTLTVPQFDEFRENWVNLRETSELLLPHTDVYELNLRFAEAQAYVEQKDFEQLLAQLCVIEELLNYVPHLITPNFNHIL